MSSGRGAATDFTSTSRAAPSRRASQAARLSAVTSQLCGMLGSARASVAGSQIAGRSVAAARRISAMVAQGARRGRRSTSSNAYCSMARIAM